MKIEFPRDFLWGSATASYQVEGAVDTDGRKQSIWDAFCAREGTIRNGDSGLVANDQYHRYETDISIMRELGLHAYRFSLAWPRIIPDGTGEINWTGVAHYRSLMQALRTSGIKVVATMYHWDLPLALEERGGWRSRDTVLAFARYAQVCVEQFNDLVDQWITINEPWCVAYLGHFTGEHAPGRKDQAETIKVIHHLNLAHGLALSACRNCLEPKPVGIAWNLFVNRNATARKADIDASIKSLIYETRIFTDPVLHGCYPEELAGDPDWDFPLEPGDLQVIGQPLDFIGVNYYQETVVTHDPLRKNGYAAVPRWQPVTFQGWAMNPYGLYRVLAWISKEAPQIPLYITENGCAVDDAVDSDGRVHDSARIDYLVKHLAICKQAIADGIPLRGYFHWSFIDNFEWTWGYEKRFGIVYCDYATQQRTIKDSGYFLRDVIANYFEI